MTNDQFTCHDCGTIFPSRQERDQHEAREHTMAHQGHQTGGQQAGEGVNCPTCGAQFSTPDQMNRHARQEHQS